MAFDAPILIWCIAVPAGIAMLAALSCWLIYKRTSQPDKAPSAYVLSLTSTILAVAWWLAVTLSLKSSASLAIWSEDAWTRMIWPVLASAVLVSPFALSTVRSQSGQWILMGWIAVVAASIAMPSGESWTDMLPLHRTWIVAITIAATFNAIALHRMSLRTADRWLLLVVLAGLACPAIIGAASYGALFQTCLAAIVATLVLAALAVFGLIGSCTAIIFPSVLFTTTMIAAGRFYSYSDVSLSDYALALFAPGLLALADGLAVRKSVLIRVSIVAIVATAIVLYTAYRFLLA